MTCVDCRRGVAIFIFEIVQYWTATVVDVAQHESSSELKPAWFKLSTRLWRINNHEQRQRQQETKQEEATEDLDGKKSREKG